MSDLTHLLRLQAHLRAHPEVPYADRRGQSCRHPAGMYSQSLAKVLCRIRQLTATFPPEAQPHSLNKTWPDVMSSLEGLLLAVDSHADDLKNILAAAGQLPSKRLKQVGDQVDAVFEELASRPINRVKHNGEKFEACYCFNPLFVVYGYFVAGIRSDGVVAPSERAHGSSGTHWSFAVTTRRLLGQLVQAARIVHPYVGVKPDVTPSTWSEQERSDLDAIATWLHRCAPYCFPNEVNLRIPYFDLKAGEPYLRIDTLNRLRSVHTRPGVRWSRSFTGDGVSRQYAVV